MRRVAFVGAVVGLISLGTPCAALRPPACRSTGCDEAFAEELASRITVQPLLAPIAGGSDAPLIDDAQIERGYQASLWVAVIRYEQTLGAWYLDVAQRYLADYAHDYPAGQAWLTAVGPLIQQVHDATEPTAHRQAAHRLRQAVERMTTTECR